MSEEEPQGMPEPDSLMEEASMWFSRMRGPEAEMHRPEFEAWLARGALHRGFYNRAGEIYAIGKFLKDDIAGGETDAGDEDDHGEPDADRRSSWRAWVFGGIAALACLVLVAVLTLTHRPFEESGMSQQVAGTHRSSRDPLRLEAKAGQVLAQNLPDGSKVTLEAETLLLVAYSARERSLILQRGSARFEVAHEGRPFVVRAGRGRVTARGTIFNVSLSDRDAVTVRLLRGSVDVVVYRPGRTHPAAHRMRVGDVLTFAADGTGPAPTPTAIGVETSAVEGQTSAALPAPAAEFREFSETPLSDVIAQTNAQGKLPIRLATTDLGALKVSGRFRLDDPARLVQKLAQLFDLQVDRSNSGEIILRRK